MPVKRPALEKIEPAFGTSFSLRRFANAPDSGYGTYWHFHPEYEIVYVSNGRGKRHIGSHISYFEDGDLIFLGPDLPHLSFTEELTEAHEEVVVQLRDDFMGRDFMQRPELAEIGQLFERARSGLSFYGTTRRTVGTQLLAMLAQSPFERLVGLLQVLQHLATSAEYETLHAQGFALEVNPQDRERVKAIYRYVQAHFREDPSLAVVASLVNMTVPAFCRYFKRLTQKTFTQFVNEVRVAHACQLLGSTDQTVAAISFDSGFNNLSHFNQYFRRVTGRSPSQYRRDQRRMVQS